MTPPKDDSGGHDGTHQERTVMVRADSITPPPGRESRKSGPPGGREWKPFVFQNLEKVSLAQAVLTEKLEWLVPSASGAGRVHGAVLARLKDMFEVEADLLVDSVHVIRPRDLRRHLADPTFLATLAPLPHKTRGFMEVELTLAHAAIDMLLGGAGEAVALRPLTDIEEGVMGFVVLEALRALSPNVDPGLPRLRMESLVHGVDEAAAALGDEQHVVVVQFKCVLGAHSGFIRLFIPATVLSLASPSASAPEAKRRRDQKIDRHLSRLAGVKTWLRAEIGGAEIMSLDLAGLRQGDVVLMDQVTVRADKGEGGTAQLRVGMGQAGRMEAEVLLEDGRYQAKITQFTFGEPARFVEAPGDSEEQAAEALAEGGSLEDAPMDFAQDGPITDDDNTNPSGSHSANGRNPLEDTTLRGEGGELLNDIPLQIAVELARVPITAEQVVSLRVGQVVDLNRVPGEPVELSVNGKIVARGELVEVEGHLGVRIMSLAG